ncbi:hypothetical protein Tco_0411360 [Tanacetum coccineum]
MAGASGSNSVVDVLIELSGKTDPNEYLKLFVTQKIVDRRGFIARMGPQVNIARNELGQRGGLCKSKAVEVKEEMGLGFVYWLFCCGSDDENNHSNGNVVKRGITRISGTHKALFLSFLGDMVREHIGLKILAWNKVGSEARDKLWDEITEYFFVDLIVRKRGMESCLGHLQGISDEIETNRNILPNPRENGARRERQEKKLLIQSMSSKMSQTEGLVSLVDIHPVNSSADEEGGTTVVGCEKLLKSVGELRKRLDQSERILQVKIPNPRKMCRYYHNGYAVECIEYAGLNQAKYDRLIPSEICIQAEYDICQAKYDRALSISKLKAALYQDFGLEELVSSLWIESEQVYDISAAYGITHWWFSRKQFYINKHSEPSDRDAVRSHMRILSVISIKTYERYGYNYLREIVLRRADYNEYKISEKDFKKDYTIFFKPRAVIYRDRDGNRKMMRIDEVHKFSDGTLTRIKEKQNFIEVKDYPAMSSLIRVMEE